MGLLGVVVGHSLLGADDLVAGATRLHRRPARGGRGPVTVLDGGDFVVLQRHGLDAYVPAHRIDHAGLSALAAIGCDRILAVSSVGALRPEHAVGTHLVLADFLALDQPPASVFDDERCHVVPGFAPGWRGRVHEAWGRASEAPVVDGGVYWQTNGPRFETPAEVRFLATFADVVGMTVGAECAVANELGLDYAAVGIVDNLANGLDAEPLTPEGFEAGKDANRRRLREALARTLAVLAR